MEQEIIAVIGETVTICFEAPDHFVGEMNITFHVSILEGEPNDPNRQPRWVADFTATLPATPAGGSETTKETLVDWVVSLPDPKLSEQICIITFDAGGTTASGRCLKARAQNRLRIPGFVVTDNAALRLIMVHEFFDPDTLAFDPRPLQERLDELTVQQRQLLAKYDLGGRQGRLVVFVTPRHGPSDIR